MTAVVFDVRRMIAGVLETGNKKQDLRLTKRLKGVGENKIFIKRT